MKPFYKLTWRTGYLMFLLAIVFSLTTGVGYAQLFNQPFSSGPSVASYVNAGGAANKFNSILSSGAGTTISVPSGALVFNRNSGSGTFSRSTNLSPVPSTMMYKIDLSVTCSAPTNNVAQFKVGDGFSASNTPELNSTTWGRFGIDYMGSNQFRLRNLSSGTLSSVYSGTQNITWVLNNSGASITYLAPDGSNETLANDKMDIWVGLSKQLDEMATTTPSLTLSDLKFVVNSGVGSITMDNIDINYAVGTVVCPASPAAAANDVDECSAFVTMSAPSVTNVCTSPITLVNDYNGTDDASDIYAVGTTVVNWTVTDACGNVSTCSQTVVVNDQQAPAFTLPVSTTGNTTAPNCSYTANMGEFDPGVTDNCYIATMNYVLTGATIGSGSASLDGVTFNSGTTNVAWTLIDGGSNQTNFDYDIVISDNDAPVISGCPLDIIQPRSCAGAVTWTEPTALDNCDGVLNWTTRSHAPGSVFPVGTTTVTYTFSDAASNTSTCSFDVVINQLSAGHTASGFNGFNISCNGSNDGYIDLAVNDNSGPLTYSWTGPGGFTSSAEDISGLVAGLYSVTITDGPCSIVYNVTLTEPLAISATAIATDVTCPGDATGTITLNISGGVGPYSYSLNGGPATPYSGTITGLTANTYVVTILDDNGCSYNTGTTINTTNTLPSVSNPGAQTANTALSSCSGVVSYTATPGGTPVASLSYVFSGATTGGGAGSGSGESFNKGVTNVIITASNGCTPDATVSFSVTVSDNENPVISCVATPQNRNVDLNQCYYTTSGNEFNPVSYTDNCGSISIGYVLSGATTGTGNDLAGVQINKGTTTVTWTVTDSSNNTNTCSFNIVVADPSGIYVNDGSLSGDVFTYGTGDDMTGDGSKCSPYATIAKALTVATSGQTIYVDAGTYPQAATLYINSNISVVGAGTSLTTIDVSAIGGTSWGINTNANGITLQDFTISGYNATGGYPIINTLGTSNLTLTNINANGTRRTPFNFNGLSNSTFTNLTATNTVAGFGLALSGACSGITINGLTTSGNVWGDAGVLEWPASSGINPTNIEFQGTLSLSSGTGAINVQPGTGTVSISTTDISDVLYNAGADVRVPAAFNHVVYSKRVFDNLKNFAITNGQSNAISIAQFLVAQIAPGNWVNTTIRNYETGHWTVAPTMKIQDAVDQSASTHIIDVLTGNYTEQVEVNAKDITINGDGAGLTNILSPASLSLFFNTSAANYPIVYVHDAANVVIQNLTVNGQLLGATAGYRFWGVGYNNAGGTFQNCEIKNIGYNPLNGVQSGSGIIAYAASGTSRSFNCLNNNIHTFQKNGTVFSGANLNVTCTGNTVTGEGAISYIAQNGIQVSSGATGTVSNNIVSGFEYSPASVYSCGILTWETSGTLNVTNNQVLECQMGVLAWNNAVTISGNYISGTTLGDGIDVYSDPSKTTTASIDNNVIEDNAYGIYYYTYSGGTLVADANENSITGASGFAIQNDGPGAVNVAATCNWYGTSSGSTIATLISGPVTYSSWLTSGGDSDSNPIGGFQPTGSCTGTPVVIVSAVASNTACNTGEIVVTFNQGTAPYNIAWTGGSASGVTSPYTITSLAHGTYNITVTDFNGSTAGSSATILPYNVQNTNTSVWYSTVQSAINAATPGDLISICAGTYNEQVTVDRSISLQGADSATCILDGTGLSLGSQTGGITINTGITNVNISKIKITNYAGGGGNANGGIYAIGGNNNLIIDEVSVANNTSASGFYANGPVDNVSITDSRFTNNGSGARGIVIWNGLKTNITFSNNYVSNNVCCGIELSDGNASGVTVTNNQIDIGNGDNAIGLLGLNPSVGSNLINGNTITGGGRFGIEIKNPSGGVTVSNNIVTLTIQNADQRDRAGIAVFRRSVGPGNADVPNGVTVSNNTVDGYQQSSADEGFGVVIEGTNHTVSNNTVTNCEVGIQQQGGAHPNANYPGDGDQALNQSANYFGRGNSPLVCGNTITGNNFSGNGTDTRNVIGSGNYGLVTNISTGEYFCNIQSAIDDAQTANSHVISVTAGSFTENVNITKSVALKGANYNTSCNGVRGTETVVTGLMTVGTDNVSINGFSLTNPAGNYVISATGRNDLSISHNIVSNVGTAPVLSGNTHAIAITMSSSANISNVNISDNCISNIKGGEDPMLTGAAAKANNGSASGIAIGFSTANYDISNLTIERNSITNVNACISTFANGGKGAYGVSINVGSSSAANTNGKTVSPVISENEISDLEGLWAHGIGLEGETPGAQVTNNIVDNLTDHKGNTDATGVKIEANPGVATVSITNNAFTNSSQAIINDMGTAVSATCNWYGTTSGSAIAARMTGLVTYSQWLVAGDLSPATLGFQLTPGSCLGSSISLSETHVNVDCNGNATGSIDLTVNGGTAPYTYNWSNGAITEDIGSLVVNTYVVTVTDFYGTTATLSVNITEPAVLVASIGSVNNVSCNGGSNGSATASATGGTTAYSYAWSDGQLTATASGLAAGTYTVTVTDAHGCTDEETVIITEPAVLVASIGSVNNVSCNGGNNGSATASATGGTTAYSYAWSDGQLTATASGLAAGTYTVTVTDAHGCTDEETVIITEPAVLVASIGSVNNVSCNGGNNGSATASATGGTAAYSYVWSNGDLTASTSGLVAGTYTVTVTDVNGCIDQETVAITEPAVLVASIGSVNNVSCNGGSNGSATASATGGTTAYSYVWSNGDLTASTSGLVAGTYTVTVTDAHGCTDEETVIITEPAVLVASIGSVNNVSCNGGHNGSATASATGGTTAYSYVWSNGDLTASTSGLVAGTYTVTVTDAHGCTDEETVTITQPAVLVASIGAVNNVSCNGGNNGSATASATGGTTAYSYAWSNGQMTAIASGLTAGTYTVTVTDANGCIDQETVTITEPAVLVASIGSVNNVSCNGGSNGSATASATGGTAAYSYVWSNGDLTASTSGLVAGTYTVTVTDANGCTDEETVIITEPAVLVASIGSVNNVSCNGGSNGSATASATGGTAAYSYVWSNGDLTASTTGLVAGTYTVTVTDANGCIDQETVTITEPAVLVASIGSVNNVSCNGGSNGSATASAVGGTAAYSYVWSNGDLTASTSGLVAGTYTVTVTDANGCIDQETVTITEPAVLVASIGSVNNVSCNGGSNGSATASAVGGTTAYSYAWSNGQMTAIASGLTAGTYTVTVTDANGCIDQETVTITEPAVLVASIGSVNNVSCNGGNNGSATASATGGTAAYSYVWSNGDLTASISGLVAGTYTVTVTDANGCADQETVTITEPAVLVASIGSVNNVSCNGGSNGSATASATGGTTAYSYVWSNGDLTASTSGLVAGTYTVTVTDAHGCTDEETVIITEPAVLVASIGSVNNVSCNGGNNGSATASATGGTTAYSYAWSDGQLTATASGLAAGTYTVTVTDAHGCTDEETVTITQPAVLVASIGAVNNVSCNGGNNGSATASATGGTTAYSYAWSDGQLTATASGLSAGTYTVTVTDAHGCTDEETVIITEPAVLVASIGSVNNVSCNGGSNGSATASATGGTTAYSYVWSNGDLTASTSGLVAGTYTVTVTDANGCTDEETVTITEPAAVSVGFSGVSHVTCNGGSNGAVTAAGSGGTPGYTYLWNDANTSNIRSGLTAGTYTVTVTDANGCMATDNMTINEPSAIVITPTVTNVSCNGSSNGAINTSVSGGTPGYTYLWNGGQVTPGRTGLAAGTYTLTVTDNNLCTQVAVITVTQPNVLSATLTATNISCNGAANGSIVSNVSGGTTPYGYLWNGGQTSANRSGLTPGIYTVTITDANGCSTVKTAIITQPAILNVSTSRTNVTCFGGNNGTANAAASGGTSPYSYAWTGPGGFAASTQSISALVAGSYTVVVTDANGCTKSAVVTITQPATPVGGTFTNNPGSMTIAGTGGTPGYTYKWNTGAVTATISTTPGTTYTVTVTDSKGCRITLTSPVAVRVAGADASAGLNVNVYPNPTAGQLNVEIAANEADMLRVSLRDVSGRLIFTDERFAAEGMNKLLFDLTGYAGGIYLLSVERNGVQEIRRVMVE